ncbi:hypothetical protein [Alicyclobacillus sp. ALC3]|uniref:hypothetical protein n=1 Tax=Alicyclobacillus sp. ALC3 TaxID=2796143 RepID=UPI002377F0F4|nr:hypothetical protein [Alicyclobacillus sp. ALC3]WDL98337.1 hypothetical protein JC200_06525 [Alicyclobacillus sp. ALC3]
MKELLWFIHIAGICLWFGSTTGVLLVWPARNVSRSAADVRTLIPLLTRTSHIGAGFTALGGTILSFLVQPKSELGAFWLAGMQGLGVVAFFISVIVLTRLGKRILRAEPVSAEEQQVALRYRVWLFIAFVILLVCLVLAAFKPTI